MILVELTRIVEDAGTVVVFEGTEIDGRLGPRSLRVTVDHRLAQPLAYLIAMGERPLASAEAWQISPVPTPDDAEWRAWRDAWIPGGE